MPHVIHVLRKFEPREWGGIETHLVGLIPELARLGWTSEVHAPREEGTDGAPLREVGADLTTFRAHYPYLGLTPERRARLVAAGGNLVSAEETWRLLSAPRADVIHVHTLGRLGGIVRTVSRVRGIPYAVSLHGPVRADAAVVERDAAARTRGMVDLGAPFGMLFGARRVVADADLVFTLNRVEPAAWVQERAGRHLALVAHGINPSRAGEHERRQAREQVPGLGDARFAVIVARLDRAKGQDVAIEAFARAAPADMHLVLAGAPVDPTFERELRARAASVPRVHVLGGVPPRVARALLAEASLALVPSVAEPFGLVLLEAWAEGTPALASAVGGLQDIARTAGAESMLVRGGPDAWASRIAEWLGNEGILARERCEGPDRVARSYSWRALAEHTASAYASAARRPS
jgi:glycosyltransferase involved in cell wall biosynthesis